MNEDFKILMDFLSQFEPEAEVQGRGIPDDDHAMEERLMRLVEGGCAEEERQQLCRLLRDKPAWLEFLARAVKRKRPEEN